MFLSMMYRDCKWLPDELKEDSFLHAKLVEKSLLRAVCSPAFFIIGLLVLSIILGQSCKTIKKYILLYCFRLVSADMGESMWFQVLSSLDLCC